jgi:hypothetical protein
MIELKKGKRRLFYITSKLVQKIVPMVKALFANNLQVFLSFFV